MNSPIRVLVVGAGREHLDDAVSRLESAGTAVTVVADVGAAIDALPDVDCVVTEYDIPDGDGVALVESLRTAAGDVPVVMYTDSGSERVASRAITAGVSEYVVVGDDLLAAVDRATADLDTDAGGRTLGGRVPFRLKERALDEAPVGITLADAGDDVPLIYLNEYFQNLTGYEEHEVIGRNCRFLQGEGTDPEPVQALHDAIANREPVEAELRNYRKDGEEFWNRVHIAPIETDGDVTHFVGFQLDVTKRRRAEEAAQRRADQLDHLVDRVEGLLQETTEVMVHATSRGEMESRICTLLANTDPYVAAAVLRADLTAERLEPVGSDGLGEAVEAPPVSLSDLGPADPPRRAVETERVQVAPVETLDEEAPFAAAARDVGAAVAVVPLVYGETVYGALHLYAADAAAFEEREQAILGSLGRMVAAGVDGVETKRIIASKSVVALSFDTRDRALFFVDLTAETNATVELAGSAYDADDALQLFFSVRGIDGEEAVERLRDHEGVEDVALVVETGDRALVEVTVSEASIVSFLASEGAKTTAISASDGVARVDVEIPREANARALVTRLQDRYDGTELASYRERERTERTTQEFSATVRDQLTDRQYTALQKAYVSDFFEWPRPVSGEDLAESMGISRPTFHQHLRAALRKLVTEFFAGQDDGE